MYPSSAITNGNGADSININPKQAKIAKIVVNAAKALLVSNTVNTAPAHTTDDNTGKLLGKDIKPSISTVICDTAILRYKNTNTDIVSNYVQ